MKKLILILFIYLFVLASPALAIQDYTKSSYANAGNSTTADGVGHAHKCYLVKVKCKTDGTNNMTVKVYDNASAASGNVVAEFTVIGADLKGGELFENLKMSNGVYIDATIAGAGTGTWWVEFKKP